MAFLIGVLIFIGFIIFCYFFLKKKWNGFTMKYFGTTDIKSVIEQAEIEDQEVPKSLSSMDSIYLDQINRDFPDVNINEFKRLAEANLLECYICIEKKDSSSITNSKIKAFVDSMIDDGVSYDSIKIHKTVVSSYEKKDGLATIYFGSSFEYYMKNNDGIRKKVQGRVKTEFIYVYDIDKVDFENKLLGLNCPNCGSPIKSLGTKSCSYCGTGIVDVVNKVWNCNDIVRY